MNKMYLAFGVATAILLALNFLPLPRIVQLTCGDRHVSSRGATALGFPFTFYTATDKPGCTIDGEHRKVISTASVWFDLIAAGAVLVTTLTVSENWKAKK